MRRRRTDTHYVKEYWFIILVAMLLCGMMLLFIASIDKQLESKKSKLQAETATLEINLNNIYNPFEHIAAQLQVSYESEDDFDSGIIRAVAFDREAKLSYLSRETAGFGGTFTYGKNLAYATDEVKQEIIRVLNTVPVYYYDEEMEQEYFFVSRHGFAVYFNPVPISDLLDENGTYDTMADFNDRLLACAAAQFNENHVQALIGPYPDPISGEMIVNHVRPVTTGGELIGVIGCNVKLGELQAFLGNVCSKLGTVYLLSGSGAVLAGYRGNQPVAADWLPGETPEALLQTLNITREDYNAVSADPDLVLWCGRHAVMARPVQDGEYTVLFAMNLWQFITENNLLLWLMLYSITLGLTVLLLVSLIKSRRELQRNNSHLLQSVEKLDYLSRYDGLTGLMKSEIIIEKIEELTRQDAVMVCMIDIDHFKQINDRYLHTFGNVVLKRTADVIRKYMPPGAYAGRFGGDEFLCLFPDTPPRAVCRIAEAIRCEVETFRFREHDARVTLSIGIAKSDACTGGVLETADQRLYRAKQNGRNQCLYEDEQAADTPGPADGDKR